MLPNQEPVQTPQPIPSSEGKKKWPIIPILIVILVAILSIFLVYVIVPAISRPGGTAGLNLPIGKKDVLKSKTPKPIPDKTVSQKIEAKKGGLIQLTTPAGVTVALFIPPGGLQQDTTMTLAPIEEPPVENIPPAPDPGVIIGPPGVPINPPGSITFSFIPSQPAAGSVVPGTNGSGDSQASDILSQAGFGNLPTTGNNNTITIPPAGGGNTQGDGQTWPDYGVLFFIDPSGHVQIIPTHRSSDHKVLTGPISQTGTVSPTSPGAQGSDAAVAQAAANGGGACTQEFVNAAAGMLAQAQASGNKTAASRYAKAIKDCSDQSLDYLKKLCNGDRRLVRREDFTSRLALMNALPESSNHVAELTKLEQDCVAQYLIKGGGENPSSTADVVLQASVDAGVCGYVDDEWKGTDTYDTIAEGGKGQHHFEGKNSFVLPARGGGFTAVSQGQHTVIVIGRNVPIPVTGLGFAGFFDGQTGVNLMMYGGVPINTEIIEESRNCTQPPPPLVPIEPIVP